MRNGSTRDAADIGGAQAPGSAGGATSALERRLTRIAAGVPETFAVVFANGRTFQSRPGTPAFTLRFRTRRAQWLLGLYGHIGLLEAFFNGDLDVDGDFRALMRAGMTGKSAKSNPLVTARNRWHERTLGNRTREMAKRNARFHYALGTDFYRLWLDDPYMMYTCGYWKEGTRTLEEAQQNKIDHVMRKIRLAPGEKIVDIGCGFGGFMFRAAERFADVDITGVNTTTEQVQAVDEMIRARGMGDRLRVVDGDFRDAFAQFDKVVSIGVLEHAGRDQVDDVVRAHAEFLKPGGLGMLHFIGHVGQRDTEFFIRNWVFPGGWIPSLAEVIVAMEKHGLEVVDIENLRRHYALTLDAWAERFDRRWETIHAIDPKRFDERFRRIWRTYLIGCAEMFRSANERTNLFQIVFSRGNIMSKSYPMSRAFLYREDGPSPQPAPRGGEGA
jgi:cyclopropane-fatty-acyl-phospholipid synthase